MYYGDPGYEFTRLTPPDRFHLDADAPEDRPFAGQTELILIDLSVPDEQSLLRQQSSLDENERQRWQRLRQALHQRRFLAAHLALRHCLATVCDTRPEQLRLVVGEFGKPALDGNHAPFFNLSHSGDWALLAIGPQPVGVDIEALIARPSERLARQVLNEDEFAQWSALAEAQRSPALTAAWTAREALLKADGGGLRWDLQRARLPSQLPGWAEIRDQQHPWWLQTLSAPEGYSACLATAAPSEVPMRRFDWGKLRPELDASTGP